MEEGQEEKKEKRKKKEERRKKEKTIRQIRPSPPPPPSGEGWGPCVTSGECAQGMLCDFGRTPHLREPSDTVGRGNDVHIPDAAVPD